MSRSGGLIIVPVCDRVLGLDLSLLVDTCDVIVSGACLLIWDLFRLTWPPVGVSII